MARQVLLNVIVAVVWVFLNNSWTPVTFVVGYLVGLFLVFLLRRFFPGRFYGKRFIAILVLIGIFFKELFLSNIDVIKHVMRPRLNIKPGIVALPTELRSSWEITMLANLTTLTPGTLTVDVSMDNSTLYIHVLEISEVDEVINDIKETFEKRIMEVSR